MNVVLIPVYNDWPALAEVLRQLDEVAAAHGPIEVVIVDDASTEQPDRQFCGRGFRAIQKIAVVRLRRNLGHQRAISVGMVYVHQTYKDAVTVVMDGDGEDLPSDIPRLLAAFEAADRRKIIFAERKRRAEGLLFKFFYHSYKALHLALTGIRVRVGNFSVVPYASLSALVVSSETWNHYAAAVLNARLPHAMIPLSRGTRLAGKSKMKFVSLVTHGLSAISVYSDVVGVRLLAASVVTIVVLIAAMIAIWAAGGSGAYVIALLLILLAQAVGMSFLFVFFVLSGRSGTLFLPIRDCPCFIAEVVELFRAGEAAAR